MAISTTSTQSSELLSGASFDFLPFAIKDKFLNSFESDLDSIPLYVFYGRPQAWDSPNGSDSPTKPNNSFSSELSIRQNMMSLSKVERSDTRIAFVSKPWSKKVFGQYDIDKDYDTPNSRDFYAFQNVANANNYGAVYKCLDNNGGVTSTERPEFNPQSAPKTLDDGYKWKYMFTISGAELSKFQTVQDEVNPNYLPINTDSTYKSDPGTIDRISITAGGSSYTPPANTVFSTVDNNTPIAVYVDGDGDKIETSIIKISEITATGGINSLDDDKNDFASTRGVGYTLSGNAYGNWSAVKFVELNPNSDQNSPNRKFAYGLAKINQNNTIDSPGDIKVIVGGSGYTQGSAVKIVQSSTLAYATVSNGSISKINVVTTGKNHRDVTIVPVSNGTGFIGKAQVSPINGHGSDSRKELIADAIFINNRVSTAAITGQDPIDYDFSSVNDFRQVGLIQAPTGFDGESVSSKTLTAKYKIEVTGDFQVNIDSIIIGNASGARGRVVDIFDKAGGGKTVRYLKVGSTDFTVGEYVLIEGQELLTKHQIETITLPEVDVFSGDILFINNSSKVERSSEQSETVNFIITF